MKRHGNLYEKITDRANLEYAFDMARKGKTWQSKVKQADKNRQVLLDELEKSLREGTYKTSTYREKTIYEPKQRTIYILPFYPDRILQHAVMNVIAPIWDKLFIDDSYACRTGKGQHAGSKRCMQFVRRNKYCLQCDISKFYPSINHRVLLHIIAKKIKCKCTLKLLEEIITSIPGEANVPIGNFTSQWFGNLYMNELDQALKHGYKVRDYIRYCDDFLLFGNDKAQLNELAAIIKTYCRDRLKLKLSKCSLYHTSQGVDFLGYRHFPDGKILVRKSTAKRMKKKIKALRWEIKHGVKTKESALSTVASIEGWLKWSKSYNLRQSLHLEELKEAIKDEKIF